MVVGQDRLEWAASPQPVRSSSGGRVESVRDATEVVGEQVAVAVERERRGLRAAIRVLLGLVIGCLSLGIGGGHH
jgi:hypothetical protein